MACAATSPRAPPSLPRCARGRAAKRTASCRCLRRLTQTGTVVIVAYEGGPATKGCEVVGGRFAERG
jgi:hypothetical protein